MLCEQGTSRARACTSQTYEDRARQPGRTPASNPALAKSWAISTPVCCKNETSLLGHSVGQSCIEARAESNSQRLPAASSGQARLQQP